MSEIKFYLLTYSKVFLKLLDQTKETILSTALEKIHIIGENGRWIFWEVKDRFCIFRKNFPNRLSKIKQRVCNLVFHIQWELCVQILKNHENKAKRPLPCFHVPYMPYFKWNVSFTKVLQKCSLTQVTILCSLWNCKNCIKMGKTQKRVDWEAKHKPCMLGIFIRSCLSNMWCIAQKCEKHPWRNYLMAHFFH